MAHHGDEVSRLRRCREGSSSIFRVDPHRGADGGNRSAVFDHASDQGPNAAASIRSLLRRIDRPWTVGLVAVVAAVLRLPAVGSGLPFLWTPDEPTNVRFGALMVDHGTLNPHYFDYPSMLYYVVAAVGWVQRVVGGWHAEGGLALHMTYQNEGINRTTDPHLLIVLRLITVVLSIGVCVLVWGICYLITRRWWTATFAGLLLAVSPLMVANGVLVTPDTYSAFFTALGLLAAIWLMRRSSRLNYVLAGAAVGFAAGAKYNAVVIAVAVVAAHFLRYPEAKESVVSPANPKHRGESFRQWAHQIVPLSMAGLTAVLAFLMTTPEAVLSFQQFRHDALVPVHLYSTGFFPGETGSSFAFYVHTLNGQGLVFPVFVGAGCIGLFGRWWREWAVAASFVLCYGWLMSAQRVHFDRNLLPVLPALVILGALGIGTIAVRLRALTASRIWTAIAVSLVVAGLIPPIAASARLPSQLDEHPRSEAQAWIYRHVPVGSTVVVEIYGPWINTKRYRLVVARELLYESAAPLPGDAAAIVLTEKGSGRFFADPNAFPAEVAIYQRLTSTHCLGAQYTDGPWIRVFVPCPK